MRSNAGMATRQGDVTLWLGLAWLGLAIFRDTKYRDCVFCIPRDGPMIDRHMWQLIMYIN